MSDQSRGPRIVAACVAGIVISTVAVFLRIWSRIAAKSISLWWDDYLAIIAWVFAVGNCCLSLYWVSIGLGQHQEIVLARGTTMSELLIPVFAEDFLYNTGITMVKSSVLCFYVRIFREQPRFRTWIWMVQAVVIAWWITFTTMAIFTCIPVQKQWQPEIKGHCLAQQGTFIAAATPNVVIDLVILLLPIPALWPLRMKLSRRLALIAIFALGYCVMIVSIIRLVTVAQYFKVAGKDFSWNWSESQILVIIEVPLGVVSICLPGILQLARRGFSDGLMSLIRPSRDTPRGFDMTKVPRPGDRRQNDWAALSNSNESDQPFNIDQLRKHEGVSSTYASKADSGLPRSLTIEDIQVQTDIDVESESNRASSREEMF